MTEYTEYIVGHCHSIRNNGKSCRQRMVEPTNLRCKYHQADKFVPKITEEKKEVVKEEDTTPKYVDASTQYEPQLLELSDDDEKVKLDYDEEIDDDDDEIPD